MTDHDCLSLHISSLFESGLRKARLSGEIVTHGEGRMTYPQFADRVRRLAEVLEGLGIGPGDRVAVLDRDTHRYLEAYFAVPMMGAVLMTANIRLSPEQLRYTLLHSEVSLAIVAPEFLPLLREAMDDKLVRYITTDKSDLSSQEQSDLHAGVYEVLLGCAKGGFQFPPVSEDAIATLFYTTGTTGDPKGVTYTHRQLVTHTLALGTALAAADSYQSLRSDDIYMPLTPMFHVHAWGMPYLATMLGLKQVYPGRYDPAAVVSLLESEGITFTHCVPTVLQMVLDAARGKGVRLENWKVMVGGAAMTESLAREALDLGVQPFAGYGMSETCPVICFARTNRANAFANTAEICHVGQPLPMVEVTLEQSDGELLDTWDGGAQGELVLRAPWLTKGYYKDPQGTADLWRGGYLHTGDVAVFTESGAIRIVDRLKDVIKSGGEWISTLDLEAELTSHPCVIEAAVVGVRSEKWGERPVAFVRLSEGDLERTQAIVAELFEVVRAAISRGRFAKFAMPDEIRATPEIPRTSVGKIDKKRLRADLAGG